MFPHIETLIFKLCVFLSVGTYVKSAEQCSKNRITESVCKTFAVLDGLKSYITVGTIYMATDLAYDYGLLRLGYPIGDILYFGRYGIVVTWAMLEFCRKRRLFQTLRKRLSEYVSHKRNSRKGGIEMEIDMPQRRFPYLKSGDHSRYDAKGLYPKNGSDQLW